MKNSFNTSLSQFHSEQELVTSFLTSHTCLFNVTSRSVTEFDCSNGIADIVFFDLRKDWMENHALGKIPPRWAYALRALPYRKYFSTSDFMSWSGATSKTASENLRLFEDLGYVSQGRGFSTWIKLFQPRPLTKKIFSIEAKIRNWKVALYQANRYKYYSNQSWVLMDEYFSKKAVENIHSFKKCNVGLATFSRNSKLTIYHSPTTEEPKSKMYYWQANALIGSELIAQEPLI